MNGAIEWFAKNPVAANLFMVIILVGGVMSAVTTKREVFPEINMDLISVEVRYLGAAPEEVEEGVSVRIEEAIQGIDGVKRITSTSAEGMAQVLVELDIGADSSRVGDEVKSHGDEEHDHHHRQFRSTGSTLSQRFVVDAFDYQRKCY